MASVQVDILNRNLPLRLLGLQIHVDKLIEYLHKGKYLYVDMDSA
jgi:hypothetical protein